MKFDARSLGTPPGHVGVGKALTTVMKEMLKSSKRNDENMAKFSKE